MRKRILKTVAVAIGVTLALGSSLAAQTAAQPFRKYVALGDSLTMAVEGACIVERHQNASYPRVLAAQLGVAEFQQPLLGEKALSSPLTGTACLGAVVAGGRITVGAVSQQGVPKNATLPRPYDNLGVSGATTADLVDLKVANPAGNTANRAAALALRNFPGGPFEGRSAVDLANFLNPDLVTLWIGNNDVLGAALSAVALDQVTLTPTAAFEIKYNLIMAGIKGSSPTIVVANIPDVAAIAFTTTIPPVVINPATNQPVLVNGQPVPLLGPRTSSACPTAPCPVPPGTLVTLGAASLLAQGIGIPTSLGGTGKALPDGSFDPGSKTLTPGVLLYPDEVNAIRTRTGELNAKVASIAAANGAVLYDVHGVFDQIKSEGYDIGGVHLTAAFLSGGIFSGDGVHPTNIGYSLVADAFIQVLNAAKNLKIERPDLSEVIFTPDVPLAAAGLSSRTEALLAAAPSARGFTDEMWQSVLDQFPPVDPEVSVEPVVSASRAPRR